MKIYSVEHDVDNFRWAIPKNESVWESDVLFFDGNKKQSSWVPIDFYIQNPLLKKGNSVYVAAGAIAYDEVSANRLASFLEVSGELLPIYVEKEPYYIHNVTEVVNALDQENTEWDIFEGEKTEILKYAFHKSRLSESSIFKLPETVRADIYVYEGVKDSEDEFCATYNEMGFEGLTFKELV